MRVALYIRVSSEEQVLHGVSLDAQEAALMDYANEKGYEVYSIYRDEGLSARSPYTKRPEMLRLLDDVSRGNVDLILFIKLDRWFRNIKEYYKVQDVLEKKDVKWKAILEDYDTLTADGRLKVNIMLSVAENEADRTAERIRFIQKQKLERKEVISGKMPFGYRIENKKPVKDPDNEAETMEMFSYFLECFNIFRTAKHINQKYGHNFAEQTYRRRLRNKKYAGFHGDIPDFFPAYITLEQHETIMNVLDSNPKMNYTSRIYLFSGLINCPYCGRRMAGRFNTAFKKYEYVCKKTSRGCAMTSAVRENVVEQYLLKNLPEQIAIAEMKSEPKADPARYYEQLDRLNRIYLMGNMSDKEYAEQTKAIKTKIANIARENSTKVNIPKELKTLLDNGDFEKIYNSLTREAKQIFWRDLIKTIVLDRTRPNRIIFL